MAFFSGSMLRGLPEHRALGVHAASALGERDGRSLLDAPVVLPAGLTIIP